MMILSIIIVNYNGRHFFDDCLKSIKENVRFKHEIIVVDNASTDGSVAYLQNHYPQIKLIKCDNNLGFSGGNNIGARIAKGKYLLLLNNDTVLKSNLSPAIELLGSDNSIGALSIRMLGKDGEYRYSAGYFPAPFRLIKFSSLYNKSDDFDKGIFNNTQDLIQVDWVEGSFLLTPTDLWRTIGGLDESYFMYVEDIDYARRVVNYGKRTVYMPSLSYVHFGGYGQSRIGMLVRGFRRYHLIHSKWPIRLLANIFLDIGLLLRSFKYLLLSKGRRQELAQVIYCITALYRGDNGKSN